MAICTMFLEALNKVSTDEFQSHNHNIAIKLGAHPANNP